MTKKGKKTSISKEEGVLVIHVNKKARKDFEILDRMEAGVSLLGSEVKSIRNAQVSLKESYIRIKKNELFLIGCHISPYKQSPVDAHEPTRERKLLLHRLEIDRLIGQVEKKGLTILPLRVYFKKGKCKIEIAVARGKKLYDKRQDVKTKEAEREMERAIKGRR